MNGPGSGRAEWSARSILAVLALLVVCAGARWYRLADRGFWLDEGYSIWNARGDRPAELLDRARPFSHRDLENTPGGLGDVCASIREVENTPPLYFLALRAWMGCFGRGEAAVRALSAVAGTATVVLLLAGAWRIAGPAVGWLAAWLLALSPMHVYYSREGRNYAIATLFATAAMLSLLRALMQVHGTSGESEGEDWRAPEQSSIDNRQLTIINSEPDRGARACTPRPSCQRPGWLAYCLWTLAGLYTNYLIGLLLVLQGAAILCLGREMRPALRPWATAAAAAFAGFLPWPLYGAFSQAREALAYTDPAWLANTVLFGAKLVAYLFVGETSLKLVFLHLWFLSVPMLVLIGVCAHGLWRSRDELTKRVVGWVPALTVVGFPVGLVAACLASGTWLLVSPRFAVLVLPALCLALAAGAHHSRLGRWAYALAALYGALLLTSASPLAPRPNEDWRAAAELIAGASRTGDAILLDGGQGAVGLNLYYRGNLLQVPLGYRGPDRAVIAPSELRSYRRLWWVRSYAPLEPGVLAPLLAPFSRGHPVECGPNLSVALCVRSAPPG